MASKSDVRDALRQLAKNEGSRIALERQIADKCKKEQARLDKIEEDDDALKLAVSTYVLTKASYEDDGVKVTRVQSHRRKWNADKLAAVVPKGIFLKIVDYVPNADKINALVSEGKLDLKKIDVAFEETPNAPYAKWTWKGQHEDHDDEAAGLAAKLG